MTTFATMKDSKAIPDDWKRPTEHSMKRRATWHDYRAPGAYMITMAVEGRRPLLGRLVFEERPVPGDYFAGQKARVSLSPLGEAIITQVIRKMTEVYPQVEVWRVCIMPDHIHMIVRVREPLPEGKHLGHVVAGFKRGCHRAAKELGLLGVRLGEVIAENGTPFSGNGTPAENRPSAENRPLSGSEKRPVPCDCFAWQRGQSSLFEKGAY